MAGMILLHFTSSLVLPSCITRVFHDKIKYYILSQNSHQTCSDDSRNKTVVLPDRERLTACSLTALALLSGGGGVQGVPPCPGRRRGKARGRISPCAPLVLTGGRGTTCTPVPSSRAGPETGLWIRQD